MEPVVRWRCIAVGRVQGVNYRARVTDSARRHGLVGSVSNRRDGTVLIDVQGPRGKVEAFLCDVKGPRGASYATSVEHVASAPVSAALLGFDILRD